ncbi:YdeI family protein [Dyadobacter sp. CY312]|uniref:YdeI/OmpD-associated family protein n=1 Tax=Dyadobacter sp. CY312 TaxID=2907303 RepID=UPI001F1A2EF6|nr:YdeI/OmpD-associated family protein [Dyadobacter sp. CY312]MCE7039009.1 YdeI/OmpD-associated family protein [Dyadobacter sp. CY312]
MHREQPQTICPGNRNEWRMWLEENHTTIDSVWLVYYKRKSGQPTLTWSDAVDEALCFGWIDSIKKPLDDDRFMQFFSRRKPTSIWSKINKEKIEKLILNGLMLPAGLESVERAKRNGSWTIMNQVEELVIPEDLEKEFALIPGSQEYFSGLSKSAKKIILQSLVLAKRPETRKKRIEQIMAQMTGKLKQ